MISILDELLMFSFHDITINIHDIFGQYFGLLMFFFFLHDLHECLVEMYSHNNKMLSM